MGKKNLVKPSNTSKRLPNADENTKDLNIYYIIYDQLARTYKVSLTDFEEMYLVDVINLMKIIKHEQKIQQQKEIDNYLMLLTIIHAKPDEMFKILQGDSKNG